MRHPFTIIALAAISLVAGCSGSYEPTSPTDLADCYRSEFDTDPPDSVRALRAKQVIIGDTGGQWLRFTTDEATIKSLLSQGFEPSDRSEFLRETVNPNAPTWWTPEEEKLTSFYSHRRWTKHFGKDSQGRAYLAHDAASHLVYFKSSAWN